MKGITELTGAAVVTRGVFVERGRQAPEGERKLSLLIQVPPPLCSCVSVWWFVNQPTNVQLSTWSTFC